MNSPAEKPVNPVPPQRTPWACLWPTTNLPRSLGLLGLIGIILRPDPVEEASEPENAGEPVS